MKANHLREGFIIHPHHFQGAYDETKKMVSNLNNGDNFKASHRRSAIVQHLRDGLWPGNSAMTFINPKGKGGKGLAPFHQARKDLAIELMQWMYNRVWVPGVTPPFDKKKEVTWKFKKSVHINAFNYKLDDLSSPIVIKSVELLVEITLNFHFFKKHYWKFKSSKFVSASYMNYELILSIMILTYSLESFVQLTLNFPDSL